MKEKRTGKLNMEMTLQIIHIFMWLVFFAVIVPLYILGLYNFMSVDDFQFAADTARVWNDTHSLLELLKAQIDFTVNNYMTWQGTFFTTLLMSGLMGLFVERYYFVGTFLTLTMFLIGEYCLSNTIFCELLGAKKKMMNIIYTSVACMQILLMQVPVEAFYWFCSGIVYMFIYGCMCLLFALMLKLYLRSEASVKGQGALVAGIYFLEFVIGGSNYVMLLITFIVNILYLILIFYKRKKILKYVVVGYVLFLMAMIVNMAAPGNMVRANSSGVYKMGELRAVIISLRDAAIYLYRNMYPPYILMGIMLIPIFIQVIRIKHFRYVFPLVVLLVSFGIYAAHWTPTVYSLSDAGPGRVKNLFRTSMLLWLYGNEFYIIGWVMRKRREKYGEEKYDNKGATTLLLWTVGGIVLCGALYFWGGRTITTVSALLSIKNDEVSAYRDTYYERLAILEDETIERAYIPSFEIKPYLLFYNDIEENYHEWANETMAEYYGKELVAFDYMKEEIEQKDRGCGICGLRRRLQIHK